MAAPGSWATWSEAALASVRAEGRWRSTRDFDAFGPVGTVDGHPVTSFASNDYLGLSSHPSVQAAAHAAIDRWGAGATASRLVVGQPTGAQPAGGGAGRLEGAAAGGGLPHGVRRQPGGAHDLRRARRHGPERRAQPRLHHRRLSAEPIEGARAPPLRPRPGGAPAGDNQRATGRGHRRRLLHGRRRGTGRRAGRAVRASTTPSSSSTRPMPCWVQRWLPSRGWPSSASAPCPRPWAPSGAGWRATRPSSTCW